MSKMKCSCGNTIVDQADKLSYKGTIIRDQDKTGLSQSIMHEINSFIDSILLGEREKWIVENYLKYDQDDCPASEVRNWTLAKIEA